MEGAIAHPTSSTSAARPYFLLFINFFPPQEGLEWKDLGCLRNKARSVPKSKSALFCRRRQSRGLHRPMNSLAMTKRLLSESMELPERLVKLPARFGSPDL